MTLDRLLVSTAFTTLGGWLMADEEAHLTDDLRAKMAATVRSETDKAVLAQFEVDSPANTAIAWFWKKVGQRLSCRICMGLEWSMVAWWATRPRSKTSPLRALVEIGAINGAHLLAVKMTTKGTD